MLSNMDFYFIELPKFLKDAKVLDNITDKWIYFIKEAENLDVIPDNLNDEGLKEAYEYANKNTWSKEELDAYNYAAMREQDDRGRMAFAILKAEQKMQQKGIEDAVIGLYGNNVPISIIANSLKITEDKVNEIIEKHQNQA